MTAELWVLLAKTGGTTGIIVIPIVWLFRRGGRISVKIHFGEPKDEPGDEEKGDGES
jgi:hypothetical protein